MIICKSSVIDNSSPVLTHVFTCWSISSRRDKQELFKQHLWLDTFLVQKIKYIWFTFKISLSSVTGWCIPIIWNLRWYCSSVTLAYFQSHKVDILDHAFLLKMSVFMSLQNLHFWEGVRVFNKEIIVSYTISTFLYNFYRFQVNVWLWKNVDMFMFWPQKRTRKKYIFCTLVKMFTFLDGP